MQLTLCQIKLDVLLVLLILSAFQSAFLTRMTKLWPCNGVAKTADLVHENYECFVDVKSRTAKQIKTWQYFLRTFLLHVINHFSHAAVSEGIVILITSSILVLKLFTQRVRHPEFVILKGSEKRLKNLDVALSSQKRWIHREFSSKQLVIREMEESSASSQAFAPRPVDDFS